MCKGKQNIAGLKALSEHFELNFTYNNHIIVYYHIIIICVFANMRILYYTNTII